VSESITAPAPGHVPQTPSEADRKQAFLLDVLATAPGRKLLRGKITPKLKTKAAQAVGLNGSPEAFAGLEEVGFVRKVKAHGRFAYELTGAGSADEVGSGTGHKTTMLRDAAASSSERIDKPPYSADLKARSDSNSSSSLLSRAVTSRLGLALRARIR